MTPAHELSDDQFLASVLNADLSPGDFDHRGHLRLAWLLVRRHPLEDAVSHLCDGLARFAARAGAPDKFHWTLSEVLLRLVAHHESSRPAESWQEFLRTHDRLVTDARNLVAAHYSPEVLATPEARRRFVAPDRLALPS